VSGLAQNIASWSIAVLSKLDQNSSCTWIIEKVVVLEFYGDLMLLDEDDAKEIVSEMILPPAIDEVWISTPQWISESDYEIGYERLC
jgi:hypothetical protein